MKLFRVSSPTEEIATVKRAFFCKEDFYYPYFELESGEIKKPYMNGNHVVWVTDKEAASINEFWVGVDNWKRERKKWWEFWK